MFTYRFALSVRLCVCLFHILVMPALSYIELRFQFRQIIAIQNNLLNKTLWGFQINFKCMYVCFCVFCAKKSV